MSDMIDKLLIDKLKLIHIEIKKSLMLEHWRAEFN